MRGDRDPRTGHMSVETRMPLLLRVLSIICGTDMPPEISRERFVGKLRRYQSVVAYKSICVSVRPFVCHFAYALRSVVTACAVYGARADVRHTFASSF